MCNIVYWGRELWWDTDRWTILASIIWKCDCRITIVGSHGVAWYVIQHFSTTRTGWVQYKTWISHGVSSRSFRLWDWIHQYFLWNTAPCGTWFPPSRDQYFSDVIKWCGIADHRFSRMWRKRRQPKTIFPDGFNQSWMSVQLKCRFLFIVPARLLYCF